MVSPARIEVNSEIFLNEEDLEFNYMRASGPGGQNVNKVSSAVQLRFDVKNTPALPEEVRQRLVHLVRNRVTAEGILIIEARRYRTQEKNRQDALDRLVELIRQAAEKPKVRTKTRPTSGSVLRRLEAKRRRSEIKRSRRLDDY